jgi:protein phosphatase 1K
MLAFLQEQFTAARLPACHVSITPGPYHAWSIAPPPNPLAPPSAAGEDTHIILASDGLFAEEERGGGGGLDNETVAELCAAGSGTSCEQLAETMALAAQEVGSTDDVTLVIMRLSSA